MDREGQGDYSNFKGSVYHLRYAIRMLLTGEAEAVWFYRGNDLLARPAPPPVVREDGPFPTIAVAEHREDFHVWVQLKFTEEHWSPSRLLYEGDTLLPNFIFNALGSRRCGVGWRVRLVAPARVDAERVLPGFVLDPNRHPILKAKLDRILTKVKDDDRARGFTAEELDVANLTDVALEVLKQLAESEPIRHETLVAEVEREIAYDYPDPLTVRRTVNSLLGAMLDQAGRGPDEAITYDAAWLASVSGRAIGTRTRLSSDPISVFDESVARSVARWVAPGWRDDRHVRRPFLEGALARFLTAPETAFVLLGGTGTGKGWGVAEWAQRELHGRCRLLLRGADLVRQPVLDELVKGELADFAPPDWSAPFFVRRLRATAADGQRGPLVFVVDDIEVPVGGSAAMQRTLADLVGRCRAIGAKLVLTAQVSVWELNRLHYHLEDQDVFRPGEPQSVASADSGSPPPARPESAGGGEDADRDGQEPVTLLDPARSVDSQANASALRHSLVVGDYTDEELADVLANRLGGEGADALVLNLVGPLYAPLRNPFLLDLFLSQQGDTARALLRSGAPVAVERLLDRRVDDGLDRAASTVDVDLDELREAFDRLIEELWANRGRAGLSTREAALSLEAVLPPGKGGTAVSALQAEGLLTPRPPVRLAQPNVADRLFARRMSALHAAGELDRDELDPRTDTGSVAALLRTLADPFPVAEQLLAKSRDWARSVSAGLRDWVRARATQADLPAGGLDVDGRALALLTILARADETGHLGLDAAEALGYLAARSRLGWKWAARLYLSGRGSDEAIGERALGATANLDPQRVAAVVRLRLQRAARLDPRPYRNRRDRERLLHGALAPFFDVRNRAAASIALRLVERYGNLGGEGDEGPNSAFAADADAVRGMAALALGEVALAQILDQLRSTAVGERFRAARALRPVALERPRKVAEALCRSIRTEDHPDVLKQLFWTAHRVATVAPEELFDAVAASRAANWPQTSRTAGTALALVSDLADVVPDRAFGLLPRDLDAYEPRARALHAEVLAYAWWRMAERVQEARSVLATLAQPDLAEVPNDFHVFALRGTAVARLGLMCLGTAPSAELVGWHNAYSGLGLQFLFLWTDAFVRRHAAHLAAHPDLAQLRQLLMSAVHAEDRFEIDVRQRLLSNAAYVCASRCLEMLAVLAAAAPDPLTGLEELPRNRQALYVARRLLELGRTEPPVVAFARERCDEHDVDGVTSGTNERERCMALLAALESPEEGTLASLGAGRRRTVGGDGGQAAVISKIADLEPARFLALLDQGIVGTNDLPTLYRLREETSRWPQQLIAEIYARMFSTAAITGQELRDLSAMLLQALAALPRTTERQEYEAVYRSIDRCQGGHPFEVPGLPAPESAIERSHRWALALLAQYREKMVAEQDGAWLDEAVCDPQGWWENRRYRLAGDTTYVGRDSVYVFPAVRLAFAAIGGRYRMTDPAGRWITERMTTSDFLGQWQSALDSQSGTPGERTHAYQAFQTRAASGPRDERFWADYGLLALLEGDLEQAERCLRRALAFPWAGDRTRAYAQYNLACVYSRMGRENDCRDALSRWRDLPFRGTLDPASDPDLTSVRGKPWFDKLLRRDSQP